MTGRILIIDDEENLVEILQYWLSEAGYECLTAFSKKDALRIIDSHPLDVVITDVKLEKGSGLEILEYARRVSGMLQVILITGYANVEDAVTALKSGAYDYIKKPFQKERIVTVVSKALERKLLLSENNLLKSSILKQYEFSSIIGESRQMVEVFNLIRSITDNYQSTVMIQGESGTGKELVARAIHFNSPLRDAPFVELNCSTISEHLFESELFGHMKGSFTDARFNKKGLLEIADGGTIFLDEIGDLKPSLQIKLLKVIEEKKFKRVGGVDDISVNVRVIVATNRNLKEEAKKGNFREELYYRLSVIPIYLPPLRERERDVLLIAQYYIDKFNSEFKRNVKGLSSRAKWLLTNYRWPGNVRELRNVIERGVLLENREMLKLDFFEKELTAGEPDGDGDCLMYTLEQMERNYIEKVLDFTGGNRARASEILGVTRKTLYNKINRYGLERKERKTDNVSV